MNTITVDETNSSFEGSLGKNLALIREQKGFTREYVAGKLNLRVRMIELLESDTFQELPQPVFVKGYLRAYAKLLEVSPEPYLTLYNNAYSQEKKVDKMLWQTKRDPNKGEQVIRWATAGVVIVAVIAVSFWWQKNKDNPPQTSLIVEEHRTALPANISKQTTVDSVSTMQSMFATADKELNTASGASK